MTQLNTHFSTSNSHQTNEPDAFPSRLLTISTLQIIANSTQFTSIKSISLQTLTHLTSRYLQLLAETAKNHADHSGRHQINAWDLVGLMEALNGNGAISSLHNWCLDQYSDHHHHQSHSDQHLNSFSDLNLIPDETYKLKKISKTFNIHHSTISPNLNPITSLSFLPLTDSEVAELDKAGETDLDESLDTPSPAGSSSSGSSEDDSDLDIRSIKPIIEDSTMIIEPVLQACSSEALIERWRSVEDIPDFVPPYFPPLPGLEKLIHQESISSEEINPLPEPIQLELQPELDPNLSPKSDPYLTSIPYHKSQLFEQYGHQPFPRLPLPTISSSSSSSSPSPPNKKIKLDHHHHHHHPTLKSFEETYSFYIEENRQNENVMLKPNPNRLKFLSSSESDQISNSLFTHIPIHSIKSNRWSAGWIPHPPLNLSHQGVSELRPFGHSALPIPLTISVPIEFPSPNLLIYPSQVRIPSLIPSIFRNLDEDLIHQPEAHLKHQTFTILNRFTRLGPPCELGQSGEPTSYRIKTDESDPSLLHPNPNPTQLSLNEKPKYMEWGFHWPSNHGHEPFESKESQKERRGDGEEAEEEEEEEKFVNAPFPAMPKTSVEKARILELQTLEREKEKRKENEEG